MKSVNNSFSQNTQPQKMKYDFALWIIVALIFVGGVVANSYFSQVALALRAAVGIVAFIVILAIIAVTSQGKKAWVFIKGARTELRKVVWPTRQETIQTTIVVVIMVLITALILWGLDSLFIWAVSWFTGQRG